MREQRQSPFAKQLEAEPQVLSDLPGTEFHLSQHSQLVGAPPDADLPQKGRVERVGLGHGRLDPTIHRLPGQEVHDAGHIQSLRAVRGAGLARSAQPWGLGIECDVYLTKLHGAHDLVRLPVEERCDRAAAGAFGALVTEKDVLAEFVADALCQLGVDWQRGVTHETAAPGSGRGRRPAPSTMDLTASSHSMAMM